MRRFALASLLAATLPVAAGARGPDARPGASGPQTGSAPAGVRGGEKLRRVDQSVADVGPVSISTKDMGVDLRVPDEFRELYQLPRDGGPYSGWFARISGGGGVIAVFPRGRYTNTDRGVRVDVPPDTRFLIGGLPRSLDGDGGPERAAGSGGRIETKLELGGVGGSEKPVRSGSPASAEPAPGQPSLRRDSSRPVPPAVLAQQQRLRELELTESVAKLFSDEQHRARRLELLLGRTRPTKTPSDDAEKAAPAGSASVPDRRPAPSEPAASSGGVQGE